MILQASVEDTPETAGKFAKKLPAFRNILIEVGFPWDVDMCDSSTISAVTPTSGRTNGSHITLPVSEM